MSYLHGAQRQAGNYTFGNPGRVTSYRHGLGLVAGGHVHGGLGGLGVLGSQVPATGIDGPGYLFNDLSLPADANREVRGLVVRWPTAGVLTAFEDSSFTYLGASDSFDYRLYVDGVDLGLSTVSLITQGAFAALAASTGDAVFSGSAAVSQVIAQLLSTTDDATFAGSATVSQVIAQLLSTTDDASFAGSATVSQVLAQLLASTSDAVFSGDAEVVTPQAAIAATTAHALFAGAALVSTALAELAATTGDAQFAGNAEVMSAGIPPGPTYASVSSYIRRYGLDEASQLLGDEQRLLTPALLEDVVAGNWRGAPTALQKAAANDALTRLIRQLVVTSNFMDGYLRSVATLPLEPGNANAGPLEDCCMALTRFDLSDDTDNATERMDKIAHEWRVWLRDVATGRVLLVSSAGSVAASRGKVRTGQAASRYDWGSFGGRQ